jgi:5-deoxy-glucuronate isomerase
MEAATQISKVLHLPIATHFWMVAKRKRFRNAAGVSYKTLLREKSNWSWILPRSGYLRDFGRYAIDKQTCICHSVKAVRRMGRDLWPASRGGDMSEGDNLVHSVTLPAEQAGELLHLPRQQAQWEWMSLFVRRLQPGDIYRTRTEDEEAAFVLLGGTCHANWGSGAQHIGSRRNVFDGLPYAVYLPSQNEVTFQAETVCEVAECRAPSKARLEPRLITPRDVVSSLRGGGNVSRQIVDVMMPAFPADKLMVIEVYTPGGNWSSYPPHKHDVHNPPDEVALDEIYYYRIREPEGFAFQHLYSREKLSERTVKARDGDAVLVRNGFHPVVAGPGYDVYYLNFLAGSSRALAVTEDSQHVWIRSTWDKTDPRLPLVKG